MNNINIEIIEGLDDIMTDIVQDTLSPDPIMNWDEEQIIEQVLEDDPLVPGPDQDIIYQTVAESGFIPEVKAPQVKALGLNKVKKKNMLPIVGGIIFLAMMFR